MSDTPKQMTPAQRAYEEKRAAKAGMSLDKWLDAKRRAQVEEARAAEAAKPRPAKPAGFLSKLLERAHKPL